MPVGNNSRNVIDNYWGFKEAAIVSFFSGKHTFYQFQKWDVTGSRCLQRVKTKPRSTQRIRVKAQGRFFCGSTTGAVKRRHPLAPGATTLRTQAYHANPDAHRLRCPGVLPSRPGLLTPPTPPPHYLLWAAPPTPLPGLRRNSSEPTRCHCAGAVLGGGSGRGGRALPEGPVARKGSPLVGAARVRERPCAAAVSARQGQAGIK